MKALKIIILILLTTQAYSQVSINCAINPTINSNNGCSISLNQIIKEDIKKYQSYCSNSKSFNANEFTFLDNNEVIENHLFKSYPLNFKKTKTGFEFKNQQDQILKIEKAYLNSNSKQIRNYDFIAKVGHFIIISQTGYESWNYLLIDLKNFNSYNLPGQPVFIDSNLIYGYTNYYGNGELTIINIETNSDVTLSFENEISNIKYSNNKSMGLLLEFRNEKCTSNQFLNIVH
ncbi:hypothetical protein [Psychroserpens jangbogonensis]|uniref:hypothetical protein n=1 Tax=Psychroserpens jangbogonensis TaxID=1484460 RepID=UPI000A90E22D|nr:hypothetical protein [Psychroserpens jangbogonensis]